MMTASTIVILVVIYFSAGFVQGLAGFAFAMICLPVLTLLVAPTEAVGIMAVLVNVVNAYNYTLHRKGVEYLRVLPLALFAMLFLPIGAYFLHHIAERGVMIALGAFVAVLTAFSVLSQGRIRRYLSNKWLGFGFGALSGLFGGAFSAPGPAIIVYLYASDSSRMRAKSNAQFIFLLLGIGILCTQVVARTINADSLIHSLPFIPAVLVGTTLGAMTSKRISVVLFQRVTDFALIVVGIYIIIRNVF